MGVTFKKIPEGSVTLKAGYYLKEDATFQVPSFQISKYPITNGQYERFLDESAYQQKRFWTEAGWDYIFHYEIGAPRYWHNEKYNWHTKPVVGISWHEAVAFCKWMSWFTKQEISLPTEQQWQRAAQAMPDGSDSGRAYVWGNEWNDQKCNSTYSVLTDVTNYEKVGNVSPCGVVDLTGNALEWCLTNGETGNNDLRGSSAGRVLKGGHYLSQSPEAFSSQSRKVLNPALRDYNLGFRVVLL